MSVSGVSHPSDRRLFHVPARSIRDLTCKMDSIFYEKQYRRMSEVETHHLPLEAYVLLRGKTMLRHSSMSQDFQGDTVILVGGGQGKPEPQDAVNHLDLIHIAQTYGAQAWRLDPQERARLPQASHPARHRRGRSR